MGRKIRLTESELHRLISESVRRILEMEYREGIGEGYRYRVDVDFYAVTALGKVRAIDELGRIPEITIGETYDDGKRYVIECVAEIMCNSMREVRSVIEEKTSFIGCDFTICRIENIDNGERSDSAENKMKTWYHRRDFS